ncbi:hypothetical protein IJJ27_03070 [bacterium]|nr:hypothetical protein [bacterium]
MNQNRQHLQATGDSRQVITIAVLSALAIFLGIGGGYLLRGGQKTVTSDGGGVADDGTTIVATVASDVSTIKKGDVFGSTDATSFKDNAQGYLQLNTAGDEGSHMLLRPGGVSQTVYLTSSVTDLDKFVGMDVRVWGETFKGQTAGWLMDVGRVEVLEVEGTQPE